MINTPVSHIESMEADMIILPGAKGKIGVLYNHAPSVVELMQGKILIYKDNIICQELDTKSAIAYIKSDGVEVFSK